jgi:hypothetical protein
MDSRYCHSSTMQTGWADDDDKYFVIHDECMKMDKEIEKLLRQYADWIYKNLEAEYDYLMSDECLDVQLEGLQFDEAGDIV